MSYSLTGTKRHYESSTLSESDRISRLRDKLNTAQKNLSLQTRHGNFLEGSQYSTKSPSKHHQFETGNFLGQNSSLFENNHRGTNQMYNNTNMSLTKALALDDLETWKGHNDLKQKVLRSILQKTEIYKSNHGDRNALIESAYKSLNRDSGLYYNYLDENNFSVLVYLITILYQELEALCQSNEVTIGRSRSPQRDFSPLKSPGMDDILKRGSLYEGRQSNSIVDLFSPKHHQDGGISLNRLTLQRGTTIDRDKKVVELSQHVAELKKQNEELTQKVLAMSKSSSQVSSASPLVMEELKRVIQEKEDVEKECINLKRILQAAEREFHEEKEHLHVMNKNSLGEYDVELKKVRAQVESTVYQKEAVEKHMHLIKLEKEDLAERIRAYELKLAASNEHNETLRKQLILVEDSIKEKSDLIQNLNYQRNELDTKCRALKKYEKEQQENEKEIVTLEKRINILREEVATARQAAIQAETALETIKNERDVIEAKYEALDNFDPKYANPQTLEQIATVVINRLTQAKDMNHDVKSKLQKMFGDKFLHLLSPLKKKLKKAEFIIKDYRKRYQEKINKYIDKTHEVEKLSELLFQAYEGIAKAVSSHSTIGLSLLKEELERKKLLFTGTTNKVEQEREDDLRELSRLYEDDDEDTGMFNEAMIPDFERSDEVAARRLAEENMNLKNQLQNQAKEISSLNSQNAQLKFASSTEETRQRKTNNTSRILDSSANNGFKTQDISFVDDEEEETSQVSKKISGNSDMYLMLRAQASSIELLLGGSI